MIAEFFWLVENEIAGMAAPIGAMMAASNPATGRENEEFQREIAELHRLGVGAVISLTTSSLPQQILEENGLGYLHLPIQDMTPPSQDQIREFAKFAHKVIQDGKTPVVHCTAGLGRTGTLLACYLVTKGHDAAGAIRAVRTVRPGAVETLAQEQAIHAYGDAFRKATE